MAPLPQQLRSGRPAQRKQRGAVKCPPVALRSLPALTCPQDERERKKGPFKGAGAGRDFAGSSPRIGLWPRGRGSRRAAPGVIMRESDCERSGASIWVELPRAQPESGQFFKLGISRSGPKPSINPFPAPTPKHLQIPSRLLKGQVSSTRFVSFKKKKIFFNSVPLSDPKSPRGSFSQS